MVCRGGMGSGRLFFFELSSSLVEGYYPGQIVPSCFPPRFCAHHTDSYNLQKLHWLSELAYLTNATLVLFTIQSRGAMRTHTKYDLTLWRGDWRHGARTSFTLVISQRAYGPAPYGTESLWKDLEKEVVSVWWPYWNHRVIACFPSLLVVTFPFKYFFLPLNSSAHLVFSPPFFPVLSPPFHPCCFFFFFLLPHLHSFLPPIPSYTLCPLTLNHRWTKQWAMSHSIKTNNPVMGGGLCGAGAAVTRHYARWVQAATNLRQRWFNSQMDI